MFTRAPATERLHNRAGGSLAETTHLGRLGGIGGSSLRPAPHTAPCSRTPCATPRMTTIYVHIPLGSDGNCLHPVRQAFLCFRKRGAAPRSVPRGLAEHLPVQSQSIGRKPKWEEQKSLRQQRPQAYACASRSSICLGQYRDGRFCSERDGAKFSRDLPGLRHLGSNLDDRCLFPRGRRAAQAVTDDVNDAGGGVSSHRPPSLNM